MVDLVRDEDAFSALRHSTIARLRQIFVIAGPYTFAMVLVGLMEIFNTMYAGRLGSQELQGVGLAMTFFNSLGYGISIGITTGYQILGPQAYGAKNYQKNGHYFNRARIILAISTLSICPILYFSDTIFTAFGIEQNIAKLAGNFLKVIGVPFCFKMQSIIARSHLRAQRLIWPAAIILPLGVAVHIIGLQLLTKSLGFSGIAIAWSISFVFEFILTYIFLYCLKSVNQRTLISFSCQDFREWGEYLRVAISGVFITIMSMWAAQVVTFFTSQLGPDQFAAQAVLSVIYGIIIIIAYSIANSMTTLIGNALGMGDHKLALKFYRDAMIISGVVILSILSFILIFRRGLIEIFTDDVGVINVGINVLVFLSIELLFDMSQAVLDGVLRGLGLVHRATLIIAIWIWLFQVPFAIGVIYWLDSLRAVYLVQSAAMIGVLICYFFTLQAQDWRVIAAHISAKMRKEGALLEEVKAN